MFDSWKERRELRKAVEQTNEALSIERQQHSLEQPNYEEQLKLQNKRDYQKQKLEIFESNMLIRKATRLGIEIPKSVGWWDSDAEPGMPEETITRWLTYKGRMGVTKLIREERLSIAEKWIKILSPIISAIISLLSLLVALAAILIKSN